ncbi:CxC2 domain-containing protein [Mycena sanguinolenta]|uniref:CxC2 domain-containing protein n=1 Tax=Mycena sanguinolenta TaxID=230812 RepID=A0A8H6YWD6_9AGAR|nr:CxC2 domain-containing protein [Mycena sanguinolenta]
MGVEEPQCLRWCRLAKTHPWYYQEDSATNAALEAADFSYGMGDLSLPPEEQDPVVVTVQKRKQYENSNYPMMTWMEYRDEYLDEMLRLEGRGAAISHTRCASCEEDSPLFRCANQVCHGPEMFCVACIIKSHACLPTHWIEASLFSYSKTSLNEVWLQKWNGDHFERRSLYDLGLVIQLGHPPGYFCPTARPAHKDFVVIDVTGIHKVRVNFCECDAHVKHRQQLMRVRWWPATVKDPQTCATFAVVRLFQIMNCLGKISAHDFLRSLELLTNNDGLSPPPAHCAAVSHAAHDETSGQRALTVGRTWNSPGQALALRCRACPQDGRNLPDGWNNINWDAMPEDLRYKYFLFLAQDCNFRLINRDVSSAAKDPIIADGLGYFVNHAQYTRAMFLANRKRVKGLRTTGVGGVTCARHNMWRPNGIGDLQLGERYCNMDFIYLQQELLDTLAWTPRPIARRNPPTITYGSKFPTFIFLLTNHCAIHPTRSITCGAQVERTPKLLRWKIYLAFTTGVDKLHGGGIFARRMKENVTEGQTHRDAFDAFNAALEEKVPELVVKWKEWVHKWESEQHTDGAASPFETQEKVGKELRSREDTPSTFIMMGLEIEESQRHLAVDVKAITNPTPQQDHDFLKRRTAIRKRILAFRKLQQTDAEAIRLFLPSDIADSTKRVKACAEGLPEVESSLWEGEVHDAPQILAPGLTGSHNDESNNVKIHKAKLRYRYARNALCRLRGNGEWERELQVLQEDDICALNERTVLNEERAQWEVVHDLRDVEEGGVAEYGVVALGEGRRTLSWIWYTAKGGEPTELELVEALRVEWCKAYARMRRWHEDVVLVEEEMRRTIQYGYWEAGQWLERSVARESEGDAVLQEGRKAYALEQAHRGEKHAISSKPNGGIGASADAEQLSRNAEKRRKAKERQLRREEEMHEDGLLPELGEDEDDEMITRGGENMREISWIWMMAGMAGTDEELEDVLRIEWAKAWAWSRRWTEEVRLLEEEWRRLPLTYAHREQLWVQRAVSVPVGSIPLAEAEGKIAYAAKQAQLYHDLAARAEITRTEPKQARGKKRRVWAPSWDPIIGADGNDDAGDSDEGDKEGEDGDEDDVRR